MVAAFLPPVQLARRHYGGDAAGVVFITAPADTTRGLSGADDLRPFRGAVRHWLFRIESRRRGRGRGRADHPDRDFVIRRSLECLSHSRIRGASVDNASACHASIIAVAAAFEN